MKKPLSYAIIIVLFSSLACKKVGLNYVRGTVVEEGTSIPVVGAKIYLTANSYFGGSQGVIDSAITNENGQYKLNFSKIISTSYYIKCVCANYTIGGSNPPIQKLKHYKTAVNFSLIPHAYIRFRYIKTTSLPNSISGRIMDGNSYINSFSPQIWYALATQPFDTIKQTIPVYGNRTIDLEWGNWNLNTGGQVIYSNFDRVFINKGDTLLYAITFN